MVNVNLEYDQFINLSILHFFYSDDKEDYDDDPTYDRVYSGWGINTKQNRNDAEVKQEEKIKVVENPYYGSGELQANEDFVIRVDSTDQNAHIIQKTENVYYEKDDYIKI